jgi:4-hydroxy-tetrahydrodipicolinate reductase
MSEPVRLLIHGASGRMGRALLRLAGDDPRFAVVAAVSGQGRAVPEAGDVPVLAVDALDSAPAFDVCIDFSLPDGFDRIVDVCQARGAALVSGTTGLDDAQRAALGRAAGRIPVLWASNFSLGVAVLAELVRRASAALPEWSIDIVESHHVHKKDAPSGTALTLGAATGRPDVHYASLRAGDIVGEHTVQFTGLGERIELTHRATHRDLFARGALEAAARLAGRPAGRHSIAEVIMGPLMV